jgi:hypothetical protein
MPNRIQMRHGDILHDDIIYVGPDSPWASPITWSDVGSQFPSLDDHGIGQLIVQDFEVLARNGSLAFPNWRHLGGERSPVDWTYPSVDEIRAELAGHDLTCWCELNLPCHADVLLRIANAPGSIGFETTTA